MVKNASPRFSDRRLKYCDAFIQLLGLVVIMLVTFKSAVTSFTHDESYSYSHFVGQSFMDIVSFATPHTNNHILNTLLMKGSEACFGSAEWVLRLHSILALAAYIFFSRRLIKLLPARFQIPGFLLLIANPFLLDFFGLARGYALAICFMMIAVCFMMKALKERNLKSMVLFNIACMLAACSNFSMINFYVGALLSYYLIMLLEQYFSRNTERSRALIFKTSILNFLFVLSTVLILWEPIRKIREMGAYDFGGRNGLVVDTVSSLVESGLYHVHIGAGWLHALSWAATASVILAAMYWISAMIKDRSSLGRLRYLVGVNVTLVIIGMAIITQHYLLRNDYFIGRFALFLFPLFVLNLLFWWKDLYEQHIARNGVTIAAYSIAGIAVMNMLYNANLHSYLDWEYDQDTKQVMKLLKEHHDGKVPSKFVVMGVYWHFEPTVNFYRETWKLNWLQPAERRDLAQGDNYQYSLADGISNQYKGRQKMLFRSPSGRYCLVYNLPTE